MDYVRLAIAILLPWLGAYFWLAVTARRLSNRRANRAELLGYSLFLGYAALQGIVLASNTLFGGVSFAPVLLALAVATLAGGIFYIKGSERTANLAPTAPRGHESRLSQVLFWLLLSWAALHLLLVAIEILHRPVFPWDAWLNWMYRAKAWFYSGQVFLMAPPEGWFNSTADAPYNVAGHHYPTFVPVLALWAVTALGQWSETLVNLPVLCCGIALGCGFYGQCRGYGLASLPSALGAYLLLSIPLVDTHLSLAGQADIWMAGFTGLGFVALLHGCIRGDRVQLLLGLVMTALGIATKTEGAVWFLAALLIVGLAMRTRATLLAISVLVALALAGWAVGITYLELPLVGRLGVSEGQLHLPLLGTYSLQSFDLWDDYRDNFLLSGTWHLLWPFILLSVIGLPFLPAGPLRRTLTAFYLVLLAAQLFIFEGTQSGQWAEDWTAINRLPLHFAPPLVFAVLLGAQGLATFRQSGEAGGILAVLPIASLAITAVAAVAYLLLAYPTGSGSKPASFDPMQLRTVVGGGRQTEQARVIDHYPNNIAIVSSGPIALDPAGYDLARVATGGTNQNRAALFWRNGKGPDDLHSTPISGRGIRWIDLAEDSRWRGQITEIGLIFYADGDRPVEFYGLQLLPYSLPAQLSKLARDWCETTTWSQRSVHWLQAGARQAAIPLPLLMTAWVAIAMLGATLAIGRNSAALPGALLCAVLAWLVLDLRWTANSIAQARTTLDTYPPASASFLRFGDDSYTRQLVDRARAELDQPGHRTIIMAEDQRMRFQMLRAKYHALPAATYVHEGPLATLPLAFADQVLVLKKRYAAPGQRPASAADYARRVNARGGPPAAPLWDEPEGFLLAVERQPAETVRPSGR
jgi:hypothetical protein